MAGHRIYSFDWMVFSDLTSNAASEVPSALAEVISDAKMRKKLRLPSKVPKSGEELSAVIRELFLQPEWFADQPASDVKLRHQLLFGMFFEKTLKSIGLSATPAWREFYECCSFNLGYCLAGRAVLDLERIKRNKNKSVYIKLIADAEPRENSFWWFGNRPYRHGTWQGSNEEQYEFDEEEYNFAVYSIQSPDEVDALAARLAEMSDRYKQVRAECEDLQQIFSDYEYCIEKVRKKKAGMFVENDT